MLVRRVRREEVRGMEVGGGVGEGFRRTERKERVKGEVRGLDRSESSENINLCVFGG